MTISSLYHTQSLLITKLTRIFPVALLIQLAGAVEVSTTKPTTPAAASAANRGKAIALAGLGVQVTCFGLFSIIAVRFHFTSKQLEEGYNEKLGSTSMEKYIMIDDQKRKFRRNWLHCCGL